MKIAVPTEYRAEFIRPKKRTVEIASLRTTVDVDIRELADVDAPVAHVLGEWHVDLPGDVKYEVPFKVIDGKPVEVRVVDGEHYVRTIPASELANVVSLNDPRNPFAGFYRDEKGVLAAGVARNLSELCWDRADWETTRGPTRVWDDQRERTVAAIERRAAQLMIVDGQIYERVGEPTLTLHVKSRSVSLILTAATRDDSFTRFPDRYNPQTSIRFGIDEYERAQETGKRLAEERKLLFDNRVEIQSVSPWHVRFRGEAEHLHVKGWVLLTAITGYAASFDRLFGRAWRDLATALYERDRVTVPMVDAMRRLCSMKDRLATGNFQKSDRLIYGEPSHPSEFSPIRRIFEEAERALTLWDTRDSCGIEWLDAGLGMTATYKEDAFAFEICDLMEIDRIAKTLECDIGHLVDTAASGNGHLVAVFHSGQVRALACLERNGQVLEAVSARGGKPKPEHLALACEHVSKAPVKVADLEAELAAFGL